MSCVCAAPTRQRSEADAAGPSLRGRAGPAGPRRGRRGPRWRRLSTHTTRADIMIWRQSTGKKALPATMALLSTSDPHHTTIPDQMIDSKLALTELEEDLLKY